MMIVMIILKSVQVCVVPWQCLNSKPAGAWCEGQGCSEHRATSRVPDNSAKVTSLLWMRYRLYLSSSSSSSLPLPPPVVSWLLPITDSLLSLSLYLQTFFFIFFISTSLSPPSCSLWSSSFSHLPPYSPVCQRSPGFLGALLHHCMSAWRPPGGLSYSICFDFTSQRPNILSSLSLKDI